MVGKRKGGAVSNDGCKGTTLKKEGGRSLGGDVSLNAKKTSLNFTTV